MKFLIVGLGNKGSEYVNTRHNIGFTILDEYAAKNNFEFTEERYGLVSKTKFKGKLFVFLKPNTYMNLSGKSINYWMQREKILLDKVLVILDDIALPFGRMRMKKKGSDAGHNGLKNINEVLGTDNYARLRFGVGDQFRKGEQVNFVLGKWSVNENKALPQLLDKSIEGILNFGTIGIDRAMNFLNTK